MGVLPRDVATLQISRLPLAGYDEGQYGNPTDWQRLREDVTAVLDEYPTLRGWRFPTSGAQPFIIAASGPGVVQIDVLASADIGSRYVQAAYALPRIGSSGRAAHTLLAWWSVLFALSMVARYVPDGWDEIISVNRSATATAVESLLDRATINVPLEILKTILAVTA